ncbi:MAG: amidohydrolase, partial [Candidatus Aminicenantes bacterium]|nr:amidohydrolase [Candidatus Aminicenantes bacterium]
MRALKYSVLGAFIALLTVTCVKPGGKVADFVLLNGSVWTVNQDQPRAQAVALDGDRIYRVGSTAEIKKLIGKETRVIDLQGAMVLPGFIDCHTHFLKGGFSLSSIQLRDVTSLEQLAERVEAKVKELERGEWIINGYWDHEQFSPPNLPTKETIDAVSSGNPVCVSRYDLHIALANSLALKIAGITKNTPSPDGGEIQKDMSTGEPTGILRDAAIDLVMSHMPDPSFRAKMRAAEAALDHARQLGVTSIHDMANAVSFAMNFEVYQELFKEGKLTSRIYFYVPIDKIALLEELKMKSPFGNDWLRIAGLKGFSDGGLGARTAYFFEPYTDDPGTSGLLAPQMFPEGIMEKRILQAYDDGIQVAIHAIGDRANDIILDVFEKAVAANGNLDRRWRIEHAQHLRPEDIGRFGKLGVIASVQPYHAIDDGRWAVKRIGEGRCRTTYAFKSLLDSGAVLALGSDWPVAPLNPLVSIYAAVTRQTIDGKNPQGWYPEQKISLEEAIKGFTLNAAYTEFAEKIKGSIEVGKLADLVVL